MTSTTQTEPPPPKFSGTPNSISTTLFEHETADADFASWPLAVQGIVLRHLDEWCARNPDKDVVGQSYSVDPVRRVCTMEFHAGEKVPA